MIVCLILNQFDTLHLHRKRDCKVSHRDDHESPFEEISRHYRITKRAVDFRTKEIPPRPRISRGSVADRTIGAVAFPARTCGQRPAISEARGVVHQIFPISNIARPTSMARRQPSSAEADAAGSDK